VEKVEQKRKSDNTKSVDTIISADTPFGISSNPKDSKKNPCKVYNNSTPQHNTQLFHIENGKRKIEYVNKEAITKNKTDIDKDKVFITGTGGSGNDPKVMGNPEIAPKNSVCSQSYLYAPFGSKIEAQNFIKYIKTKFFRILVSAMKITQSAPNRVYKFVPLQNFTANSDIDWQKPICEIDKQLYTKYNLSQTDTEYIEKMIAEMK
jgi:hypothetical protein